MSPTLKTWLKKNDEFGSKYCVTDPFSVEQKIVFPSGKVIYMKNEKGKYLPNYSTYLTKVLFLSRVIQCRQFMEETFSGETKLRRYLMWSAKSFNPATNSKPKPISMKDGVLEI